jgi:hypothetical protein
MKNKYYFLSFVKERLTYSGGVEVDNFFSSTVIVSHPADFIAGLNNSANKDKMVTYILINYKEIKKEEYTLFKSRGL